MMRSKHPYTARSSAIVIRHAVAIDERRAKFRQDLIGVSHPSHESTTQNEHLQLPQQLDGSEPEPQPREDDFNSRYRRSSVVSRRGRSVGRGRRSTNVSPARQLDPVAEDDVRSMTTGTFSLPHRDAGHEFEAMAEEEADEALPQVRSQLHYVLST